MTVPREEREGKKKEEKKKKSLKTDVPVLSFRKSVEYPDSEGTQKDLQGQFLKIVAVFSEVGRSQ